MARRFNDLNDCRRFLAKVTNDLHDDKITTNRARALGYLTSIMQRIIEGGDLERRLEELEEKMGEDRK